MKIIFSSFSVVLENQDICTSQVTDECTSEIPEKLVPNDVSDGEYYFSLSNFFFSIFKFLMTIFFLF